MDSNDCNDFREILLTPKQTHTRVTKTVPRPQWRHQHFEPGVARLHVHAIRHKSLCINICDNDEADNDDDPN